MIGPILRFSLVALLLLASHRQAQSQFAPANSSPPPSSAVSLPTPALAAPWPPSTASADYPEGDTTVVAPLAVTSEDWCAPAVPCRTSSWTAAIELIPSEPLVTDGQFGRWDDDGTLALRLVLGYEDTEGIGIRARFWGLSQTADTALDDVELNIGSFDLDLYKRFFLDRGEIAIGAGPASGGLEFKLDGNGRSQFEGGGGTVFLDGYYGLIYFERSELGAVGRARYSLLVGDWRDSTGGAAIPRTNNDTMGVTELAWGLEFRRPFGSCRDHNWFVGVLAEYQRWQSDWMASNAATSVGVSGLNVYTGLNW